MAEALKNKPQINLPQPTGILSVKINAASGTRVPPDQPGIYEVFRSQNVPNFSASGTTPSSGEEPLPGDLF